MKKEKKLKIDGMKRHNFLDKCSLCGKKKKQYTAVLSVTHNYVMCIPCYQRYDSMDTSGKKWMEKEFMSGTSEEERYKKGD